MVVTLMVNLGRNDPVPFIHPMHDISSFGKQLSQDVVKGQSLKT